MRPRLSSFLQFARALAVVTVCLSTPTLQDIVVDVSSWLTGDECCSDDCEQSGAPCQEQCVHWSNACHLVALPTLAVLRGPVEKVLERERAQPQAGARPGHLEPPFRPPVS